MKKEVCQNCNKKAQWIYMPSCEGSPYFCDDCVPRGCFCNYEYANCKDQPELNQDPPEDKTKFKWLDEEKNGWTPIDKKGREYPCVEYSYCEEGFDVDE
jgi:hypothetical protein